MVDHLWAGWRMQYVTEGDDLVDGRPAIEPSADQTLFEAILASGLPDEETFIVWRGERCFALLNAFPYTSGHVMVLPNRGVADLEALDGDENAELWDGVRQAVMAIKAAYEPDGVNVGANIGRGAGAGIPDHLHVHVLPRWQGDTNFISAIANTRVMPEALIETWRRIVDAWP